MKAYLRVALVVLLIAIGLYGIKKYNEGCICNDDVSLDQKTVIVTGGNTGIGYETSKALALKGATVIIASHNVDRIEEAIEKMREETKKEIKVIPLQLDLSSLESIRDFATEVKSKNRKIHVLINNAGVWMGDTRQTTKDGFEMTFGVNHLGHFLLTHLLLDEIKEAKGRIVTVSSGLHQRGVIDFDNLQSEKNYSHISAYANSKLANVLFSNELSRRLAGTGVSSFSLHPGVIFTNLHRQQALEYPLLWQIYSQLVGSVGKTSYHGAQTTITAAISPKLNDKTGLYLVECEVADTNPLAQDKDLATRLWEVSEKLVGLQSQGF